MDFEVNAMHISKHVGKIVFIIWDKSKLLLLSYHSVVNNTDLCTVIGVLNLLPYLGMVVDIRPTCNYSFTENQRINVAKAIHVKGDFRLNSDVNRYAGNCVQFRVGD